MKTLIVTFVILICFNFNFVHARQVSDPLAEKMTDDHVAKAIIEAWEKHNSFNILILNFLSDSNLKGYSSSKGRNVGEQFAHIHETRLNWLTDIAPEVAKSLNKIHSNNISTTILKENLLASSDAIKSVLLKALNEGKLSGYPNHPVNFYTYLVSHESHHRGQILLSLKQSGYKIIPEVSYGIWNWSD